MGDTKKTADDLGLVEHVHTETPDEVKKYWEGVDPKTVKPVPMPIVVVPSPAPSDKTK
jgi:hypothetical protein